MAFSSNFSLDAFMNAVKIDPRLEIIKDPENRKIVATAVELAALNAPKGHEDEVREAAIQHIVFAASEVESLLDAPLPNSTDEMLQQLKQAKEIGLSSYKQMQVLRN